MAAGDITVEIIALSGAAIDARITALRATANDKFMMVPISEGKQVLLAHIEEA